MYLLMIGLDGIRGIKVRMEYHLEQTHDLLLLRGQVLQAGVPKVLTCANRSGKSPNPDVVLP